MIKCIHCIVCVQQDYTPALNRINFRSMWLLLYYCSGSDVKIADCRVNGVSVVKCNELHTGSVPFRNFPGPNQRLG